jgi:DNA (cytosine-5)-methyltransferase 1
MDGLPARTPEKIAESKERTPGGYANLRESVVNDLMPTPKALDGVKGNLKSSQERLDSGHQVDLPNVAIDLLPTTTASDWKGANNSGSGTTSSNGIATVTTNLPDVSWGKFAPAIERWENVLGRLAPAPTKPDGREEAHRLSSEFTEWMMGLPAGWVTDCGLTRNEELKACGNGVVPQQAELALRFLLQGINLFADVEETN